MFKFSLPQSLLRQQITQAYCQNEEILVQNLLQEIDFSVAQKQEIETLARSLVSMVRKKNKKSNGINKLMQQFPLSSEEGIALMCLAESLLRVPDKTTQNKLIKDKLSLANFKSYVNKSSSLFVNLASLGLLLTGKLVADHNEKGLTATIVRGISKGSEPLIRKSMNIAMRLLGKHFVLGQTIIQALKNGKNQEKLGYRFSFDMLGESALTDEDAQKYYQDYVQAIHAIGKNSNCDNIYDSNGISVKISAIHPRYVRSQYDRVIKEIYPKLKELFLLANKYNIGLTIDAEEVNRLDLSLDLLELLANDKDLYGFNGIGFVVQAYQKRASFVIDYLIELARKTKNKFMIRLVKGAYWDSEIKLTQIEGLEDYPVYTRKCHTDISYLACAKKLLSAQDEIFPQFASHNAYTVAAIYYLAKGKNYEFQCLHGMGQTLYDLIVGENNFNKIVRIYAPVGTHNTLLAYLVRRLIENGANSSFVNQIVDNNISVDDLVQSPIEKTKSTLGKINSHLPIPCYIYKNRLNSKGLDLSNEIVLAKLEHNLNKSYDESYEINSLLNNLISVGKQIIIRNPANHADIIGTANYCNIDDISKIVYTAKSAQDKWNKLGAEYKAKCLEDFAMIIESKMHIFIMLIVREAGKTIKNAISEIREAVDFCRYYAQEARNLPVNVQPIGTIVAISPWNFPLAIFIGQIVSALVAGNTVIAKSAQQTMLVAHKAIEYLYLAQVPTDVVQLVLGDGEIGQALVDNVAIDGVIFTGSFKVAKSINKSLLNKLDNPNFIAETGGQNAMIVDSTALPEQVVQDVILSAFDSAGQRCSALRVLCLQADIYDRVIHMLKGAMQELIIGNPVKFHTDIGPVIDNQAKDNLLKHINLMKKTSQAYTEVNLPNDIKDGTFIAPIIFEINNLDELKKEVFGPVLHIVRFDEKDIDKLIHTINAKGYALTFGIHSRINSKVDDIISKIEAGNIYVNRNIVGAVVGVQPFGGHGLSGTGPKAGGPFYLQKLVKSDRWSLPQDNIEKIEEDVKNEDLNNINELESAINAIVLNNADLKIVNKAIANISTHSLNKASVKLSGPTGELNMLSWKLPNNIWIYGGEVDIALSTLCELVGNGVKKIYVDKNHSLVKYSDILGKWLVVEDKPWMQNIDTCITFANLPIDIKLNMANVAGLLIKIIDARIEFDILKIYQELSVSINTTACGGNINLMSMNDM